MRPAVRFILYLLVALPSAHAFSAQPTLAQLSSTPRAEQQLRFSSSDFEKINGREDGVDTYKVYNVKREDAIRPLHQNWWPVAAVSSLDPSRPNPVQVLGKSLVGVYSAESWRVLDDRCSHRFAPLSEGRIVTNENGDNCLQCAYHGWEFDAKSGHCTKLPQDDSQRHLAASVETYPTRVEGGMLWVWTDPSSSSLSRSIDLPISSVLRRHIEKFGDEVCFMRDLPYGMELLGENLLDLSHLPFSHHSVGMLKRDLGGPLPTRMLSKAARLEHDTVTPPRYLAEILNASQYDPILMNLAANDNDASCKIGFYDPCHVRYRRTFGDRVGHVELFLCPLSEGKSRVFVYNVFAQESPDPSTKLSKRQLLLRPSTWAPTVKKLALSRLLNPASASSHKRVHLIFDGDGVFLHKQGNRMRQAGLTFRDYSTPTSADVLLAAYRRFLGTAAAKSTSDVADAVTGTATYTDDQSRAVLLDRYNSHTVHCPLCKSALKVARQRLATVKSIQTAVKGAMGSTSLSLMGWIGLRPLAIVSQSVWRGVLGRIGVLTLASTLLNILCQRQIQKLTKEIDGFLFIDYVHADKD